MDEKIIAYLESLVADVLASPNFANLSDEQKNDAAHKIRDNFNEIIFESLIQNLSHDQLQAVTNLGLTTPEGQAKIEEFSSQIPNSSTILESSLSSEVEKIKANPALLSTESSK